MVSLRRLLTHGYFPKELPPVFTTESFGIAVTDPSAKLPESFSKLPADARLATHNIARVGTLRRTLGIPNPVLFYRLAITIAERWAEISPHYRRSELALSSPKHNNFPWGRAILTPRVDIRFARASSHATVRYLLKADISRFYHSIYTHSIPWALHGKAWSKIRKNRFGPAMGNELDKSSRNAQGGQTLGIPIGPDTSLAIADLILSAVDEQFCRECPRLSGFRMWDEYELGFSTRSEAEAGLAILQEVLGEMELALNSSKTRIIDLPQPFEARWVSEIRNYPFRQSAQGQASDIVGFFDRVFENARLFPTESVVGYAVQRLSGVEILTGNWSLVHDILIQAIIAEPGTFQFVLPTMVRARQRGLPIQTTKLCDAINLTIRSHAPLGHGSEVAWALWATLAFQLHIDADSAQAISRMSDSFVALLALDADANGLIHTGLNTEWWASLMRSDELYQNQWLLAYEANVKGWLPGELGKDHVQNDANFGFLKTMGVSFYESNRRLRVMNDGYQPQG
ncbi:MAG: hypothetical protein JWM27_1450 [Gemmatimonadetes bacterium]|nr:hypothetical protein [Gemmatimonadota bacterium]